MRGLILLLTVLVTGLAAQTNPMFDSLSYFERNKIKTIHCKESTWWYGPVFPSWKISFNKENKTYWYHSLVTDDTTNEMLRHLSSALATIRDFNFRDTIIWRGNNTDQNIRISYQFDNKSRLLKKVVSENNFPEQSHLGFRFGEKDTDFPPPAKQSQHITTINFFYSDTSSAKLSKVVTESPYHIEVAEFYYEKFLLSMQAKRDSNKITHEIEFELIRYDYYPDRKLKREIRRVASDNCPGIVGRTVCEGVKEYKYDTEFPNDSTPIPGVQYVPLVTIFNKRKTGLYAYLWAYPDKGKKDGRSQRFSSEILPDSTCEIVWDPRPDRKDIQQIKKDYSPIIYKEEIKGFDILIYEDPDRQRPFYTDKRKPIYTEKVSVESIFKKPKIITITERK